MPFLDSSATRRSAVLCLEFCLCSCFTFVKEKKNGHETTANWRGKKTKRTKRKKKSWAVITVIRMLGGSHPSTRLWTVLHPSLLDPPGQLIRQPTRSRHDGGTKDIHFKCHKYLYINITYLFTMWAISQLPTWKIYSRTRTHSISS